MSDPITPAKGLTQPLVGGDNNDWGGLLNNNLALIDSAFGGTLALSISGDVTLTGTQAQNTGYKFIGVLAGTATIIWPAFSGMAVISNGTTGGHSIICGLASGTQVTISASQTTTIWSDGANFYFNNVSVVSSPLTVTDGITSINTATNTALGVASGDDTSLSVTAGAFSINLANTNAWTAQQTFGSGNVILNSTGVGIGAAPTQGLYDLQITDTVSTTGFPCAYNALFIANPATNSNGTHLGFNANLYWTPVGSGSTVNLTGNLEAGSFASFHRGQGTVANAYGSVNGAVNKDIGTITSAYGSFGQVENWTAGGQVNSGIGGLFTIWNVMPGGGVSYVTGVGVFGKVYNHAASIITSGYAGRFQLIQDVSGGTITNGRGIEITRPLGASSGTTTWTNIIGIHIGDQNPSGAGTNTPTNPTYAIEIDSQTASGAFAFRTLGTGLVQFGDAVTGLSSILSNSPSGGIGYKGGAGGTVTQITSKSTAVLLNVATGKITTTNDALAPNTTVSFTFTNSSIASGDVLILNHLSGGTVGSYHLNARCVGSSATIDVRNISTGSLSEAITIAFVLIKGATA